MRVIFFIIFCSIGAVTLSGAILYDELLEYHRNKQLLDAGGKSLKKLESLSSDYDVLTEQLKSDPNLVKRAAAITLGKGENEPNTVYPKAKAQELEAAREAVADDANQASITTELPKWVQRCGEKRKRITLAASGAVLILISFAFFGPREPQNRKKEITAKR